MNKQLKAGKKKYSVELTWGGKKTRKHETCIIKYDKNVSQKEKTKL